ncbi:MAG: TolC family protein [Pirellulales bacterium]
MRCDSFHIWICLGLLVGTSGCTATRNVFSAKDINFAERLESDDVSMVEGLSQSTRNSGYLSAQQAKMVDLSPQPSSRELFERNSTIAVNQAKEPVIQTVSHEPNRIEVTPAQQDATLTIDGRTFEIQLVERQEQIASNAKYQTPPLEVPNPTDLGQVIHTEEIPSDALQLNLPTALSMIGGQHPAVGFAQWRVQEAYARLDQANVLWLPSIQSGFSFHKHDGNYQASDASIVDVNRNSFQYGLGAGATGAGTTPRPGVVARFHLADAIFQPQIAEKTAWARGHAATGVINEQLLNVAVAYLELLNAEQDLRIVEESQTRTSELSKLTSDFATAGQGLQADADRLQTELMLVENRIASARERVEIASARLSQALSVESGQRIVPLDPTVVPIDLVSLDSDKATLISTGLANRPELKDAQALVAAAYDHYQREKYAPFVPSVLLGFSAGGFGGGLGNNLNNVDDRYDFDALLTWEIRNLGFGEGAARRETEARTQQAKYKKVQMMDEVVNQISEAHSQIVHRGERIEITKKAIQSATDSYQRNLSRIRNGQGLPLEVLQSVQALEDARRAYLQAVVEYNESQFRLQWALGWPVFAPEGLN